MSKNEIISVFEHDPLHLEKDVFERLSKFHQDKGNDRYFDLYHNAVKFKEYVGVIQVGNVTIEVLPKADKNASDEDKGKWRDVLINMLRTVGGFNVFAPTESSLNIKPNSILDLYFEIFVQNVEYLLHTGLVKKYRRVEGNRFALKGSLNFAKNIQQNLIHKERFYVNYTTYDTVHDLHKILYKALKLLMLINTNPILQSRIGSLMLNFPEMPDIKISDKTFDAIVFDRKTEGYKNAVSIARLLLLQYHPDLSGGRNHVLALMFDMNLLWEKFVYVSLAKKLKGFTVRDQVRKKFWGFGAQGRERGVNIIPDILIARPGEKCVVLDTKWKNIQDSGPVSADLQQLYSYSRFFDARKVALVYPGDGDPRPGFFLKETDESVDRECSVIRLEVAKDLKKWQQSIADRVKDWIGM